MEFGERLKHIRETKGITQQTLANQLFVTRQTVSYWETGGVYQVSSLEYNRRDIDNPRNIKLISQGNTAGYFEIDAATFTSQIDVMLEEEVKEFDYAAYKEEQYNKLADVIRANVDMDKLYRILERND
mgnify:CR=1 FL=1